MTYYEIHTYIFYNSLITLLLRPLDVLR